LAKPFAVPKRHKLALVGGETLLGREIQEVLSNRQTGALITAYAASGEGNFGEQEGEAVYVDPLEASSLAGQEALIVAGSEEGALKAYNLVKAAGGHPALVDGTAYLETQPEARIVAPLFDDPEQNSTWLRIVAHPAASALALALTRLARRKPIQQAIAHIFEPASERGKRGASELHQQTTSLLAFKSLEKNVFDAQLGFNMLAQYGEQAPVKLFNVEQRIERHVATLLSRHQTVSAIPMPSLRLIQAPVFHGYSISLWAQFTENVNAGELGEALASAQIEIRDQSEEAPHNVGAAGQSGLIAGDVRVDPNDSRAAWLWIVADNLRLIADAVADLVSGLETKQQ
jgi:aspartate-semialdehyde dehydrogenase